MFQAVLKLDPTEPLEGGNDLYFQVNNWEFDEAYVTNTILGTFRTSRPFQQTGNWESYSYSRMPTCRSIHGHSVLLKPNLQRLKLV